MKITCSKIRVQFDAEGHSELVLTTTLPRRDALVAVAELQRITEGDKLLAVNITQHRRRRSLDANSYCWVVCQKIAEVIRSTKEEVYRKAIRDVGQFEILPIRDDAVETWIRRWGDKGLGWFAEVMEESKLPGYTKVISYFGSSCYDTREMAILIDELVATAQELGIETLPPSEVDSLKNLWGEKS
jgi:hypothetical protein